MKEKRIFEPPKGLVEKSNVKKFMDQHGIKTVEELYERAKDREWFWGELAKELHWHKPWDAVVSGGPPYFKWFEGGKTNVAYNALDRHVKDGKGGKVAYIWEGELGDVREITYGELYKEVNKIANGLRSLGIKKGDRIGIYLPMVLELPTAMLACAKIGAVHSVVFSGFSPKALEDRLVDAECVALITSDGYYRKGAPLNLKEKADEAVGASPTVKHVVVVDRMGDKLDVNMVGGRDHWWHDLAEGQSEECEPEVVDSGDLLFFMYTSGTTGKPKGVMHVHGGYQVGASQTLRFVFDLKEDDIWWCAADIGWITGHSYIVYGPLILGVTSVLYEGAPTYPEPDRYWEMVEKYKVTVFYTSPTAVRLFMRFGGEWPGKHDLSSLRLLGSVGEPINPEAWMWYHEAIGQGRCPIMDTWWQTETGQFVITPLPVTPLKPGSATFPFPSIEAAVYDDEGNPVTERGGNLVITSPWPGMLAGLYKQEERYERTYWARFPGVYLAGDVTRVDEDGYFWVQGRADDVLNVAGHRIGTAEVESALVSHPKVAEAAVVGKPDPIKGSSIQAFVIIVEGTEETDDLRKQLVKHVSVEISPIARPDHILFVPDLPKTRSGKIMRRVMASLVRGESPGDVSTLRNPEVVDEVRRLIEEGA
jgi:acetyl-CoA synthetase